MIKRPLYYLIILFVFIFKCNTVFSQNIVSTTQLNFGRVVFLSANASIVMSKNSDTPTSITGAHVVPGSSTRGTITFYVTGNKNYNLQSVTIGNATVLSGYITFQGGTVSYNPTTLYGKSNTVVYYGGTLNISQRPPSGLRAVSNISITFVAN